MATPILIGIATGILASLIVFFGCRLYHPVEHLADDEMKFHLIFYHFWLVGLVVSLAHGFFYLWLTAAASYIGTRLVMDVVLYIARKAPGL